MDVEQLRQDLRDIRIFAGRYFPFMVIPLNYVRIVATHSIPTAGVDEKGTFVINPDWWAKLDVEARRFVTIHECSHICLCHPFRQKGFNRAIYNIAADGKINNSIREAEVSGVAYHLGDEATLEKISKEINVAVEILKKMSTEEIARELEDKAPKVTICTGGGEEGLEGDLLDGTCEGEVVQEGDKSVSKGKSSKELEKEWKLILERARDFAKQAGRMPSGLERLVDEVLEVKPPWHLVVRFGIRNHAKQDSSFAYPSRRGDDYPGYYGYRYSVWCLVDCSGSISQDELKHFLGVVKFEAKKGDIYAIPWDGEAYEVLKATKPADVARRIAPKMRGGGGTVCKPVLEKVYRLMRAGDAVVMLTDGDIFDAEEEATQNAFRRVATKAGFAMIGYTHKPVIAPGFTSARIDFKEGDE